MTEATQVTDQQRDRFRGMARGDEGDLGAVIRMEVDENIAASGLDARTYAMTNIAVLIATRAETPSFMLHVARAIAAGVTPDELLGVLTAVAPNVGIPKVVDAAPRIAAALDIDVGAGDGGAGGGRPAGGARGGPGA
jgi:4-carboxymuconolactone decarboxylase